MNKLLITLISFIALSSTAFAQSPNNYIYTDNDGVIYELDHDGPNMDLTGRSVVSRDMVTQAELDALNLKDGERGIQGLQGLQGHSIEGISGAGIAGGVAMIEDKGVGAALTGGGGFVQADIFGAIKLDQGFKVGVAFTHSESNRSWIKDRNRVSAFGVLNF